MRAINPRETWEAYTGTWALQDEAERLAVLSACVREDVVYTDPNTRTVGRQELSAYMDGFQKNVPGARFVTEGFAQHHDCVLVRWKMVDSHGVALSPGTSFGSFGPDGRLASMTGFFAQEP